MGSENDDGGVKWWPAVAWLAADPHLARHVTLVSETVRTLVGVGFENKVMVRKYQGQIREAEKVVVHEIMTEIIDSANLMRAGARDGWRFFLENLLSRWINIFLSWARTETENSGDEICFRRPDLYRRGV